MKLAVYGASGYTGRLVAAEALGRGVQLVLAGRNAERLRATLLQAPEAEIRVASADDDAALVDAFHDCDAVINCAGPFTLLGTTVPRAAIAAGCQYVDPAGEQGYMQRLFDECSGDAERAGVTLVTAAANDGLIGDLLAHITGSMVAPLEALTISYRLVDFGLSRGSMRSALEALKGDDVVYRAGEWRRAGARVRRPARRFPETTKASPMMRLAGAEVITVPRHLDVGDVEVTVNADSLAPRPLASLLPSLGPATALILRSPMRRVLTALVSRLPEGPSAERRQAASFTFVADAVGRTRERATGVARGSDVYGNTAVIAVEAARRLVDRPPRPGVLAPAEAFEAADFLELLGPHGVSWSVALDALEAVPA